MIVGVLSLQLAVSGFVAQPPLPALSAHPTALARPIRVWMADDAEVCVDEICAPEEDEALTTGELLEQLAKSKTPSYAEESRKYRRTVYMHDEWVKHRSSERFYRNMQTIFSSGVSQALSTELTFITSTAAFIVFFNCLVGSYADFGGVQHAGPLQNMLPIIGNKIALPALPFTVAMPALALLITFRTNTAYFRWNEARTLWGGVINSCRNVVRQANLYLPDTPEGEWYRDRMQANTAAFAKCLRNFLRGPSDDPVLSAELDDLVAKGSMSKEQKEACMAASNRPFFCLSALSKNIRDANIDPMDRARIDATLTILGDLTGACERVFKSPIPLVYTRHTARFLTSFLALMPLALWEPMGVSWNHWATVPATFVIAFFLFGIEEIGIQIEEPFSILPLEAFCNGAIAATMEEMVNNYRAESYDGAKALETPSAKDEVGVVAKAKPQYSKRW